MGVKVEKVVCPSCKQKLALQGYIVVGSQVVCANPKCNTSLHVTNRNPLKVEHVPIEKTLTPDFRPEAYG